MVSSRSILLAAFAAASSALLIKRDDAERNDGIHLAVGPHCGSAKGNATDVNEGLRTLTTYKTVVSFGDSYTAGGRADGGPLLPPVLIGNSPKAGGRTTNGPVWSEDIANDIGATFMDYAIGGAVTDARLWPAKANNSDFIHQVDLFLSQNNVLDPKTTLYTIFFGINDYSAVKYDGNHMPQAAQTILDQIARLMAPPTNAESFLVPDAYGRGKVVDYGEQFKELVYAGLRQIRKDHHSKFRYAYVDFKYLWDGVLVTDPGYAAFGYTSTGDCTLNSSTIIGACSDPDHTFYWIPGHPSKQTHRIMADYVEEVMDQC
ncbi:carbohydrate esterase family 16 protein [Tulasnella calospora MUT 4182]|uniref:Carbohydrate esterase family 16 protein n=1 Tax=Tulasnella calospora MUT 4182 TaxID=1051891 RepID=A0A0C3LCU3_9AGAM|nr:carbohydrate esterase family 16 protein [Tulasnella calospora MUT 4182]